MATNIASPMKSIEMAPTASGCVAATFTLGEESSAIAAAGSSRSTATQAASALMLQERIRRATLPPSVSDDGGRVMAELMRASDTEREEAVDRLRAHAAEGRLDVAELEERIDAAFAARTREDLTALFADLPDTAPRRAVARPRRRFGPEWYPYVAVNLMLVVIWATTGMGYFWPIWPILGWGVPMFLATRGCGSARGRGKRVETV